MKRINTIKFILGIGAGLFLTGCSMLSPVSVNPMHNYQVTQLNPNTVHGKSTNMTLLVAIPTTAPGYESGSMAYMEQPYQLTYFTQNRWLSSPAAMLQPLLVQSLQNTKRYKAVVASPYAGFSDMRLDVVVVDFYQDFTQKPSREKVTVLVQLINLHTHRMIASTHFSTSVAAPSEDPYGGVIAANRAVAQLLGQIAQFAVKNSQQIKPLSVSQQMERLKFERYEGSGVDS